MCTRDCKPLLSLSEPLRPQGPAEEVLQFHQLLSAFETEAKKAGVSLYTGEFSTGCDWDFVSPEKSQDWIVSSVVTIF